MTDPHRPWQEDMARLRSELWTQFGIKLDELRADVGRLKPVVDDLVDIVIGNDKIGVKGLKTRLDALETKIDTLIEQRDRLIFLIKVVAAVAGGTSGANLLLELLRITGVIQ